MWFIYIMRSHLWHLNKGKVMNRGVWHYNRATNRGLPPSVREYTGEVHNPRCGNLQARDEVRRASVPCATDLFHD